MDNPDLRRRLQYAWSYQQKARAAQPGDAPPKASVRAHAARAGEELQRVRSAIRREIAAEQGAVERLRNRQQRLGQRVSEGRIAPEKANAENRKLTEALAKRLNRLSGLGVLLSASSASEAGGFIDLPLDQYSRHSRSGPSAAEQGFALVCAVAVSLSIAAMWAAQPGGLRELTVFPGGLFRALHFTLPLFAGLFLAPRRVSGPVFVAISAVLLLVQAVLAPGYMSAVVVAALQAAQYVRMGVSLLALAVYVGGAAALAELGLRRMLPGSRLLRRWSGAVALLAGLVFAAAVGAFAGDESPQPVAVRFETHVTDPGAGVFLVMCHNASGRPVRVMLPLPVEPGGAEAVQGPVYGVRAHVRERGEDTFRLVPQSGAWWQGAPGAQGGAAHVEAPPHGLAEFTFSAAALAREGIDPAAIRLVFLRKDGVVLDEFEYEFTGRVTAAASLRRRPQPQDPPRADRSPERADPSTPQAPSPPPRRPPGAEPVPPPPLQVRYLGRVNQRAVLQVRRGLGDASRVAAEAGESIAPEWRVDAVLKAERAVRLVNPATGGTVTASAGQGWVELPRP